MALLQVRDLVVRYGDFEALHGIDLTVAAGETLAVIGANGAGKSTLLKALSGLLPSAEGTITFEGHDIVRESAPRRVRRGIAMTPEGRRIFPSLTVEENLRIGAFSRRPGPWNLETVLDAIPLVRAILRKDGHSLSGGEQQATAIARTLMGNPRLMMLDEVSLGLAPVAVEAVYAALPDITSKGTTVLLVEQDVRHALSVADRVQVLLEGRTVLSGPADGLSRQQLVSAYFGL